MTPPVTSLHSTAALDTLRPAGGPVQALGTAFVSPRVLFGTESVRVQALASACALSAPVVDAHWMASWLEAFTPPDAFLLCAHERGGLVGLAALQRLSERWHGGRITVIQSLTNVESYRFEFLAADGRLDIARHLWRTLCRAGTADVIRLDHVPDSSPTLAAGLDVAREHGWRTVIEDTFATPLRALSSSRAWDQGLRSSFKYRLRNRLKRLAVKGDVGFEMVSSSQGVSAALPKFYQLEASGWKGVQGTAVVQQPAVKRLYDEIAVRACGDVRLALLTVAGTPIAAQVLRLCGRTLFMLKIAYDEAYGLFAPGQLLTARVVQYGIQQGIEGLDFLADNAPWKEVWATGFVRHRRLLLFAPTLAGHYAYWTGYGIRDHARRVPGFTQVVRWMRRTTRSEAPDDSHQSPEPDDE
jgi:CelD/BcsL family acetyltransferase involved in cellulose biosynthesis